MMFLLHSHKLFVLTFHSRQMQTLDRLQGTGIILEFRSEVGSRGPGTIRVVMRSEHFSSFSPETLYTGGSCFVSTTSYMLVQFSQWMNVYAT